MYFSRPQIKRLNLDLLWLSGGGSSPSQFKGTIADGREIYIRYRGGWLSVHIFPPGEMDWKKSVLKQKIGQAFSGDILKEQVCELLGLTLNGEPVTISAEEFQQKRLSGMHQDFSGQTLYWQQFYVAVTTRAFAQLIEALKFQYAEVYCLKSNWNGTCSPFNPDELPRPQGATDTHFYLACNENPVFPSLTQSDVLTQADIGNSFAFSIYGIANDIRKPSFRNDSPEQQALENFEFPAAFKLELRWETLKADTLRVRCSREFMAEHDKIFRSDLSFIDIMNGGIVPKPQTFEDGSDAFSSDLQEWASQAGNRILGCYSLIEETPELVGVRPAG